MATISDADRATIREHVHAINNALNVVSMQSELVKVFADDAAAADRISSAIDRVLEECRKAGDIASDIGRLVKASS